MAKVHAVASITMYGKVPDVGWRRGSVVLTKNGLPKPNIMLLNGTEVYSDKVQFQIRS
jgi:hypothetical protein